MIKVTKPIAPAHAAPMPSRKIRSSISATMTAPQPMKIADEYRLVTGGRSCRYIRENRPDVCHLRQSLVTLNHGSDVIEFCLVEIFAHRAFARRLCCTRDSAREAVKFGREILCVLGLNAVFQALIQREPVTQIQDRALI